MTRTRQFSLLVALAVVGLLAGCAPSSHVGFSSPATSAPSLAPSAAPTATADPVPTPTATPTPSAPAVDPNVLFTITATTKATVNHAKADLVETVYKPVATTPDMAGDTAILNKQCDGWKTMYPNRLYMTATFTATLEDGSPAWPKNIEPVGIDLGAWPAFSGDYEGFEAACSDGILKTIPGVAHGVVPIPVTKPATGTLGWAQSFYGFAQASDGPESEIANKFRLTMSHCTITLSAAASANSIATTWPAHPHTYGNLGCEYGTLP